MPITVLREMQKRILQITEEDVADFFSKHHHQFTALYNGDLESVRFDVLSNRRFHFTSEVS